MNKRKLQKLVREENALYTKAKIVRRYIIVFPKRKKPPFIGKIIFQLLQMYKARIEVEYLEE